MAGYIGSKTSVTQVDGYNRTEADAEFVNDPNGAITVDGSNNVGIGTSSPGISGGYTSLALNNSTNSGWMQLMSGGTSVADWYSSGGTENTLRSLSGGFTFTVSGASDVKFNINSSERMRLDSDGRLLLNTGGAYTYPNNVFEVSAGSGQYAAMFSKSNVDDEVVTIFRHAGATGGTNRAALYFMSGPGAEVGKILINGTSTSYATTSDYRLKTDAQPMTGASARVQALNPVNFEWIADGTRVDGFLAHEAQDVVPEAVTGTKDAVDADGNPDYQGIDQSKLVPLLTAALQEALTKIDALETRITALEG